MKQSVYIDILIVLNIFVNYFLLLETSFISNEKIKRLRLLLGSILGGVYSLILILPPLNTFLSILIKLAFSITIILAAFKIKNLKHFLRLFAIFFAVNFIFAGLMLAVWIVLKPNGMQFNNGAIYFEMNALMLIGLTIFCYTVVSIISKLSRKNAPQNKIIDIIINFEQKQVSGKALIDTGNSLKDTFSGTPVVVAEYDFIKEIIPVSIMDFMKNSECFDTENIDEDLKGRIRLIPFNSIGGNGLLKAFRPDSLTLIHNKNKKSFDSVYVAIKNISLSNGEYIAIVSPVMIDEFDEEVALK
ncbi:MAG: sigma-E processing peptidase SpoIIGA [Oscillospiraceae bacterium]